MAGSSLSARLVAMLAVACIATSAIGAADAAHVAVALSFPEGSLASMTQTSTGPVFTALPNTYETLAMPQWSNAVRVAVANTTSSMVDNVLLRTGYETMDGRLVADFRIITANDNQDSVIASLLDTVELRDKLGWELYWHANTAYGDVADYPAVMLVTAPTFYPDASTTTLAAWLNVLTSIVLIIAVLVRFGGLPKWD